MDKGWTEETEGRKRSGPCLVFLLSLKRNCFQEFEGGKALAVGKWKR